MREIGNSRHVTVALFIIINIVKHSQRSLEMELFKFVNSCIVFFYCPYLIINDQALLIGFTPNIVNLKIREAEFMQISIKWFAENAGERTTQINE